MSLKYILIKEQMMFVLFLCKKLLVQFICNFIPSQAIRKKIKQKAKIDNFIKLDQVDSFVPTSVLKAMKDLDPEFFIQKNQNTINGGGHYGYFNFDVLSHKENSPRNPWAFIRVKNEARTLQTSLESILPAIQRGVIGYNDCDDGSKDIILEFCKKYPSFIPLKYPYNVQIQNPQSEKNKLCEYYNYVLEQIPKNQWLIKIDTDQIYDSRKLYKSFYLAKYWFDCVNIARIDLCYIKNQNKEFEIRVRRYENSKDILDEFFIPGTDHWLIFNKKLHFYTWHPDPNKHLFYEGIRIKYRRFFHTELNNYHFPFIKTERYKANKQVFEKGIKLSEIHKSKLIGERIDKALLSDNKILAYCRIFDSQDNVYT